MAESGVTVILGGTRGIGAAVAHRLACSSETLVLNYLQDQNAANAISDDLKRRGVDVRLIEGNVTEPSTRKKLADAVQEAGGVCHRLVHSVAVTSFKPLTDTRANQWDLVLAVSARSLLDITRVLVEPLARAGGGRGGDLEPGGSAPCVPLRCPGARQGRARGQRTANGR